MAFYPWDAAECTYVVLSIIFNVLFVIVLRKYKKEFSGEFFILCISQAIADFGQLFFGLFIFKLPSYRCYFDDLLLVYAKDWLPKLFLFLIFLITPAQIIGMVNLAANRYTALAKPTSYSTVWGGKTVRYCILAQWLCPAIYVAPMLFVDIHAERNNKTDFVSLYFTQKTVEYIYYGSLLAFGGILANCTVLVLYCIAFYKALSYRRKVFSSTSTTRQTNTTANHTEVKLAVCGFTTFCIVLVYSVLLIFTYKAEYDGNEQLQTMLQKSRGFLVDIYSSVNPYTLLIMSAMVREKFAELLHLKNVTTKGAVSETELSRGYASTSPHYRDENRPNIAMVSTSFNSLPSPANTPTG